MDGKVKTFFNKLEDVQQKRENIEDKMNVSVSYIQSLSTLKKIHPKLAKEFRNDLRELNYHLLQVLKELK